MLIFTAALTAIGSIGDGLAVNYPMLAVFRFITGMAIDDVSKSIPIFFAEHL